MNKKWVSLFTLIIFSVFTFSCITRRTMQIERFEEISPKKTQKFKVLGVVKTNGEVIKFGKSKKNQGKIVNNNIIGGIWVKVWENIAEVDRKNIKKIRAMDKGPKILITKDGQIIKFNLSKEEKDKIILYKSYKTKKMVTIPFSEIKLVRYKRFSLRKTFGLAGLAVGVVLIILFVLWANAMAEMSE